MCNQCHLFARQPKCRKFKLATRFPVSLVCGIVAVCFSFMSPAKAQLVEIDLLPDEVNSDIGLLAPPYDLTLVEYTLTDPFAYNPNDPTSTSPSQILDTLCCYHSTAAPSGGITNIFYQIDAPTNFTDFNADRFVVDLWGMNAYQERDNDFDVVLRSGGFDGLIVSSMTGLAIPDGPVAHRRVTFDHPSVAFDTIEIVGRSQYFTIAETRAAALNPCDPNDYCRLPGDVNLDRSVDLLDGEIIAANFYQSVALGDDGDLNLDGFVSFPDFRRWKDAFANGDDLGSVVPEPTAFALSLLVAMCCIARRPCRR